MLDLNNKENWDKLSGPFDTSGELPNLLRELENSFSKEIVDEIFFDYISHQGSLYECTFATIPYLVEIAQKSPDNEFRWNIFVNAGVILSETDNEDNYLTSVFKESSLESSLIEEIKTSYKKAFQDLAGWGKDFLNHFPYEKDDTEKIYFLAALATFNGLYLLAQRLILSADIDEFAAECLTCDAELYFENEDGKLALYMDDPVFNEDLETVEIKTVPVPIPATPDKNDLKSWFSYYVNFLRISALEPLLPYLFGSFTCEECSHTEEVFTTLIGVSEEPIEREKWTRAGDK